LRIFQASSGGIESSKLSKEAQEGFTPSKCSKEGRELESVNRDQVQNQRSLERRRLDSQNSLKRIPEIVRAVGSARVAGWIRDIDPDCSGRQSISEIHSSGFQNFNGQGSRFFTSEPLKSRNTKYRGRVFRQFGISGFGNPRGKRFVIESLGLPISESPKP
jgi:hypothetical protein